MISSRKITLYWREKILILFFGAQMHGILLRATAYPPQWRIPMSWSLLLNLDILRYLSINESGESSVIGFEILEPFLFRMAWAGAYTLLAIVTILFRYMLLQEADRNAISIERFKKTLDGTLLFFATLFHVPACLSYAAFFSSFWPSSPLASPVLTLTNPFVIIIFVIYIPFAFLYTCLTPFWLLQIAARHTIHSDSLKHEYALETIEIEYALRISNVWQQEHVWVLSSFMKHTLHTYDAGLWILFSGACAWIAAGAGIAPGPQADVIFAILAVWSFRHTISSTYRCLSTNLIYHAVLIPLVITSFFGLLRAHEISNELTVDRRLTQILKIVNIIGAALILFFLSVSLIFSTGWPMILGTNTKKILVNSSIFEEIYEGISLLFKPFMKKTITQTVVVDDDDDDKNIDHSTNDNTLTTTATATLSSMSASFDSSSDSLAINSFGTSFLNPSMKKTAKTFIEMQNVDDLLKNIINEKENIDIKYNPKSIIKNDILLKVEAEIISLLRILKNVLTEQRTRPHILVDINKLQEAISDLQRPFGNALYLKLTLAKACVDAISEGCIEIETAKKYGSIANHTLFSQTTDFPFLLEWLHKRMKKRNSEFVLLTRRKMIVLLKLLAIRAFTGNKKFSALYIPGVNDSLFLSSSSSSKRNILSESE
jgi:hypothetical protein